MENTYSAGQAARQLGLSVTYVHHLIADGKLSATKTPLGWLVDGHDLQRLAAEREQARADRLRDNPHQERNDGTSA